MEDKDHETRLLPVFSEVMLKVCYLNNNQNIPSVTVVLKLKGTFEQFLYP